MISELLMMFMSSSWASLHLKGQAKKLTSHSSAHVFC